MQNLTSDRWLRLKDVAAINKIVSASFGAGYTFEHFQETPSGTVPVLKDDDFGFAWVLVPEGSFVMGLSEDEKTSALALSPAPYLTFAELGPPLYYHMSSFLITQSPLAVDAVLAAGEYIVGEIGIGQAALVGQGSLSHLTRWYRGALPTECEWEYACRGGTQSLFWFGSLPREEEDMETILGLAKPVRANGFGLTSLFHGEWCSDVWRPSLDGAPQPVRGQVIRGGGSRFWPWQEPREWAGCVSAFRMPSADTGGAGAAVRLVRHPQGN